MLNVVRDVYCKPTPSNFKEILGLIFLCLTIAVSTGGLLYVWMTFTLKYDPLSSLITAAVCGSVLALGLSLVHPIRCAFTIIIPSLGTKQGRKILISTALTILATTCFPNMARNVSSVVRMMKCSTQVTVEGILSSTTAVKSAIEDMKETLERVPEFTSTKSIIDLQQPTASINEMLQKLEEDSKELKAQIKSKQEVLETTSNVVQKIIALAFVLLLLGSSAWYLIGYLTDLNHNNVYITHRLIELLKAQGEDGVPVHYKKKLVKSTGWKMTRFEVRRALLAFVTVVMYGFISAVIIGLDYYVFNVLENILEWTRDIPEIRASMTVHLKVWLGGFVGSVVDVFGSNEIINMWPNYRYVIPLLPPRCVEKLSPPEQSVLVTVGTLYLTAFIMLLVEVYARRIRRKICASFYRSREEERVQYLLVKVLEKREVDRSHPPEIADGHMRAKPNNSTA